MKALVIFFLVLVNEKKLDFDPVVQISIWSTLVGYLFWWLRYVMNELMMVRKSRRLAASFGTRCESSWTPKQTRPGKFIITLKASHEQEKAQ